MQIVVSSVHAQSRTDDQHERAVIRCGHCWPSTRSAPLYTDTIAMIKKWSFGHRYFQHLYRRDTQNHALDIYSSTLRSTDLHTPKGSLDYEESNVKLQIQTVTVFSDKWLSTKWGLHKLLLLNLPFSKVRAGCTLHPGVMDAYRNYCD